MVLSDLYSNNNLIAIDEAFNSSIDIDWEISSWGEIGVFAVDNVPFVIELQKISPSKAGLQHKDKVAEVTFYRYDKDVEAGYSTTGESNSIALTIYGVVYNAIKGKVREYDGFYFTAERRHSGVEYDKKVGIYTMLARRVSKELGINFYINVTASATAFLLTNSIVDSNFKLYHKKITEHIDWDAVQQKAIKR